MPRPASEVENESVLHDQNGKSRKDLPVKRFMSKLACDSCGVFRGESVVALAGSFKELIHRGPQCAVRRSASDFPLGGRPVLAALRSSAMNARCTYRTPRKRKGSGSQFRERW